VRYCGHVPRNYQYKDGIQQVFLLLRDHLGDENLDLAGGVLYELIEIDCEHTHDPGAAFQRWRHDHMSRYVRHSLELHGLMPPPTDADEFSYSPTSNYHMCHT
jgi:hypothetical protein